MLKVNLVINFSYSLALAKPSNKATLTLGCLYIYIYVESLDPKFQSLAIVRYLLESIQIISYVKFLCRVCRIRLVFIIHCFSDGVLLFKNKMSG